MSYHGIKFKTSQKKDDETYLLWVNRLRSIIAAYHGSRKVTTFDDLVSLLIADHVKSSVDGTALGRHIMALESSKGEGH